MQKSIKTIIAGLKKRFRGDFIRDLRVNDDATVTFKVVRKDDTWREITEKV
jgi:hypothetical protein